MDRIALIPIKIISGVRKQTNCVVVLALLARCVLRIWWVDILKSITYWTINIGKN